VREPRPTKGYLLDIEGVLVRNKAYEPVPGAVDWVARLDDLDLPYCLVSNNTTDRPADLIERLNRTGYALRRDRLVGALELGRSMLLERGIRKLCWLGVENLRDFWEDAGFSLTTGDDCEAVVMGVNPGLTIRDLEGVLAGVLDRGVDLVCLHRNTFYLDDQDRRRMGPGCWSAALEALGGCGQVHTVGKPDPGIYLAALKRIGVEAEDTLFISDDPVSDLITAGRLGMQTAFVLSGKHPDHEVLGRMDQDDWPDIICNRLSDISLTKEDVPDV